MKKLFKWTFDLRNFLWRLKLRLIIRGLKILHFRFIFSKKGMLVLTFAVLFAGIVIGQAWRIVQIEPQFRRDLLFLLGHIKASHQEIDALRARLADAEGKVTQRMPRGQRRIKRPLE